MILISEQDWWQSIRNAGNLVRSRDCEIARLGDRKIARLQDRGHGDTKGHGNAENGSLGQFNHNGSRCALSWCERPSLSRTTEKQAETLLD